MAYPTFEDIQGFPITASMFTKQHTPSDPFPPFKASIPKDGIHASQYSYFEWGAKPDATPKTELRVLPTDVITKPIDGFGIRVSKYIKLLRNFTLQNKIFQSLLNDKKKTVGVSNALNKRFQLSEAVRSMRNEVAGMTPQEAERRAYDVNNLSGASAQTFNDINSLIRGQFNTNRVYDQPQAPTGGLAAQTAMMEEGMAEAPAQQGDGPQYQPTPFPAMEDIPTDEEPAIASFSNNDGSGVHASGNPDGMADDEMDFGKGQYSRAMFDEAGQLAEEMAQAPGVNSQVAEQLGHFARNTYESSQLGGDALDGDEQDLLGAFLGTAGDPDFRAIAGIDDETATQYTPIGGGEESEVTTGEGPALPSVLPPREGRGVARRRIAEMIARGDVGGSSRRKGKRRQS